MRLTLSQRRHGPAQDAGSTGRRGSDGCSTMLAPHPCAWGIVNFFDSLAPHETGQLDDFEIDFHSRMRADAEEVWRGRSCAGRGFPVR